MSDICIDDRRAYEELKEICYMIGCSGLDTDCSGNPLCSIIRKVVMVGKNK